MVTEQFSSKVNTDLLKKKKVLILDGNKQAVESQAYFENQPTFNEMNLAVALGIQTFNTLFASSFSFD